jgi:hypothetical protein
MAARIICGMGKEKYEEKTVYFIIFGMYMWV